MSQKAENSLRKSARELMRSYLQEEPGANLTELAEYAAIELDEDQWLDDSEHWIWDVAIECSDW